MKTLILGAGINNYEFDKMHYLCSWDGFFRKFFNATSIRGTPATLIVENCIRNTELGSKIEYQASNVEKNILDNIAKEIDRAIKEDRYKVEDYEWILKNKEITDIISLNFYPPFGLTFDDLNCKLYSKESSRSREFKNNCLYWTLKDPQKSHIRFWFPHGCINDSENMILGAYRYMKQTAYISHLVKQLKKREREIFNNIKSEPAQKIDLLTPSKSETIYSWLIPFYYNELFFLGTSISTDEWAIWSAITLRIRNFTKKKNQKYELPIYQMQYGNDLNEIYTPFIKPLFHQTITYDNQWDMLKKEFEKNK